MKKKRVNLFAVPILAAAFVIADCGGALAATSGTWKHNAKGYWYEYADGSCAKSKWVEEKGKWYYFNKYGYMVTGWKQIGQKWYYFGLNTGAMQTGWKQIDKKWYYFDTKTGALTVGWKQIGKKWYYFNKDGVMQKGWQQIGGKWYLFNTDGSMYVGWKAMGSTWYFFNTNGAMQIGWKALGSSWYFFNPDGSMVTGYKTISGTEYYFDENGKMSDPPAQPSGDGVIKAPSTSGWTSAKKIYAYSWDDDFGNKLKVVLDKYPQYKQYVEYVSLGVASEQSLEEIDKAMKNGSKYPSLIPADISLAQYWSESDKTMDLGKLGFNVAAMRNSYQYALDYGTYNGKLKAVTWQSTAGSVFYNRKIAKEVFGTDDPATIQKQLKDWDSFFAAAKKLKAKGYKIVATYEDIFYALTNSRTEGWIRKDSSGKEYFTPDATIKQYIQYAKTLVDYGYTGNDLEEGMWTMTWADGMADGGNVFCYFGCPWMIGVMRGNGASDGGWATCVGPTSYYWGGTYVCIGANTPNPELAAFLLYELTCDPDIAVSITNTTGDAVNNKEANSRLAKGELDSKNAALKFFGGQNPYAVWADAAKGIRQTNMSFQDQNLYGFIMDAARGYIGGDFSSVDEAVKDMKKQVSSELGIPSK